jgi:hypothetical protein
MNYNRQIERARVGFMGRYEVAVYTDDVYHVPHVHIEDTTTEKQICCVRLDHAEYLSHGNHVGMFNHEDCCRFDDFMREPSRNVHYRNNYEAAVNLWNDNNLNPQIQIEENENGEIIVPDYTKLR